MSVAVRYAVPRMRTPSDLPFLPLIYPPLIGYYFQGKAIEVLNKNIKELIQEEKRSVTVNHVPQMKHLIELERETFKSGRYRDLFTIALVVAAFVTGYMPLILALFLSVILGLIVLGATGFIVESGKEIVRLQGRTTIPDTYSAIWK